MLRSNPRFWIALLAAYWISLAVSTHLPSAVAPAVGDWWDKVLHSGAFGALGLLSGLAAGFPKRWLSRRRGVTVALALAAYAAIDELTQPWTGRQCDPIDWLCDALGIVIGVSAAALLYTWRRNSQPKSPPNPN